MKLIIGLGNPGVRYAKTYHNLGKIFANRLIENLNYNWVISSNKTIFKSGELIVLIPNEFMNLSHSALRPIAQLYKIALSDILVLHDELMKKKGVVNLKYGGGNAGHNGLRGISEHIGNDFWRLQIGIDHPKNVNYAGDVSAYVLSQIEDLVFYEELFNAKAFEMIRQWITSGSE